MFPSTNLQCFHPVDVEVDSFGFFGSSVASPYWYSSKGSYFLTVSACAIFVFDEVEMITGLTYGLQY
jgi:hypothetical protein